MKNKALSFYFAFILFVGTYLLDPLNCISQETVPISWQFSSNKKGEDSFEIHLKATVKKPWHTYSQTTPEGGPVPTKIIFDKNPLVVPSGPSLEKGDLKIVHDPVFEVDVKYFEGNVDFVQIVRKKGNAKTSIRGTVEFMVCNNEQCLPPKTIAFNIQL
jgi:DsbC/DsbD-like thiol-disulfide interchange protein